ncbi:hypothetical protein [Bacteroides acidifaciens]
MNETIGLEEYKRQAFSLLTSDEGLKQRGRRCIEPKPFSDK